MLIRLNDNKQVKIFDVPQLTLIALFITFFVAIILLANKDSSSSCFDNLPTLAESNVWQITHDDFSSEIIWQKTESRGPTQVTVGTANSEITASDHHILYRWIPPDPECRREISSGFVAFDRVTGVEQWHYPAMSNFRRIQAISGGYLVIAGAGGNATKIDYDGQVVWSLRFPSRSIEHAYEVGNDLYFRSYNQLYEVAPDNGVTPIRMDNIADFFGDISLVYSEGNILSVIHSETREQISSLNLLDSGVAYIARTSLWPFALLYNGILVTVNNPDLPTIIQTFHLETGEAIWTLTKSFYSFPILLGENMFIYSEEGLEVYDIVSGEFQGRISLNRTDNGDLGSGSYTYVSLAGYYNVITIYFQKTGELVTLRVNI